MRERILAEGRAEFARLGLAGGSVRSIAARAGVTAAMINYYFGGKRALYDAVVSDAQSRLAEKLSRAAAEGERAGLAARLAGAYFDFLAEDSELQRVMIREVLDRGDAVRDLAARYVEPLRVFLAEHFGDEPDALDMAVSLFGAIAGYFLYEPVVGVFLRADPTAREVLARRREHVVRLANLFEEYRR